MFPSCRLLSSGSANVAWKVYRGAAASDPTAVPLPGDTGELPLRAGHMLLAFGVVEAGEPMSVEVWPVGNASISFFGCDRSPVLGLPEPPEAQGSALVPASARRHLQTPAGTCPAAFTALFNLYCGTARKATVGDCLNCLSGQPSFRTTHCGTRGNHCVKDCGTTFDTW